MLEKEENVIEDVVTVDQPNDENIEESQDKEEAAPVDPLADVAYFVISPENISVINQAIDLVPEKMTVLKKSIVEAINSTLVPVTKVQLEEARNLANPESE